MKTVSVEKKITHTFVGSAIVTIAILLSVIYISISFTEERVFRKRVQLYDPQVHEAFEKNQDKKGVLPLGMVTTAYLGFDSLPPSIRDCLPKDFSGSKEIHVQNSRDEYWVWGKHHDIKGRQQLVYIVKDITGLEMGAEKYFWIMLSVASLASLIILILVMVIHRKARQLADPLIKLSRHLRECPEDSLEPIVCPPGTIQETEQLINSLNNYRHRIKALVERERAFTRFASHELRTPLTVVRGVASLLGKSAKPDFLERQKQRLINASEDMADVIDTLLNLVRHEKVDQESPIPIDEVFVQQLLKEHEALLRGKAIAVECHEQAVAMVLAPNAVLRILLGNVIKNAFACTEQGNITINIDKYSVTVIDSGCGLESKPRGHDGYGLGLLIVNDICRKYGWDFSLENNVGDSGIRQSGCTARVIFSSTT